MIAYNRIDFVWLSESPIVWSWALFHAFRRNLAIWARNSCGKVFLNPFVLRLRYKSRFLLIRLKSTSLKNVVVTHVKRLHRAMIWQFRIRQHKNRIVFERLLRHQVILWYRYPCSSSSFHLFSSANRHIRNFNFNISWNTILYSVLIQHFYRWFSILVRSFRILATLEVLYQLTQLRELHRWIVHSRVV